MKKSALIIILASLSLATLSGCSDNAPELNNYNCTTEGLDAYRHQEGTEKEAFIQFKEQCEFKRLGSYSKEWKDTVGKLEWDCALVFDKEGNDKCIAAIKKARADLTAKYKAEANK